MHCAIDAIKAVAACSPLATADAACTDATPKACVILCAIPGSLDLTADRRRVADA